MELETFKLKSLKLERIDRSWKVSHLVGKSVFGLVVTHIGFVHIRRLKVVLTLIGGFKVVFTAW